MFTSVCCSKVFRLLDFNLSSARTARHQSKLALMFAIGCIFSFNQPLTAQEEPPATKTEFEEAAAPPVRRIIFFNSGIAQVVHQGTVTGNQVLELEFERSQIDDVLKSLVFEINRGQIESVQYHPAPGKELIAADRLGPPMTLAQTLQMYRGEPITMTLIDKEVRGSILGVETRQLEKVSEEVVNLLTDSGIQSVSLIDATNIQFDAKPVQEEFKLALQGHASSRDDQRKSLQIFLSGDGERKLQFAYVVDAPVWRMTYRMAMSNDKVELVGWAHVDNVTNFDWENVYINLRSGRPQSFNVALFAPLVAEREKRSRDVFGIPADLKLTARHFGLGGRVGLVPFDGGLPGGSGFGGGQGGGGFGGLGGGGGIFGGTRSGTLGHSTDDEDREALREMDITQGVQSVATEGRAARLTDFQIAKPINLAAGHSAMIPVFQPKLPAKTLTRFDLTAKQPVAELVVRVTNSREFWIPAGPVTIYQTGGFTGDAEFPRTDIGEDALLKYGLDLPLSLVMTTKPLSPVYQQIRIAENESPTALIVERVDRREQVIKLSNKDISPRTVLLQLPLKKSTAEPAPEKIVDGIAEFEIRMDADSDQTETILVSTAATERVPLTAVKPELLRRWQATKAEMDEAAKKLLAEYFVAVNELAELGRVRTQAIELVRNAEAEQTRLTELIKAVKSESAAAPFVEKLTEGEQRMIKIRLELSELEQRYEAARRKVEKLVDPS